MNSVPLAEHMRHIRANDWETLAGILAASAHKVARAGADFAICPDNTYHQAFKYLISQSPIPWLHIAAASRPKRPAPGIRAAWHIRDEVSNGRWCLSGGVGGIPNRERNTPTRLPGKRSMRSSSRVSQRSLPEASRLIFQ